jgi:1,2-dihydroxy-3-keto-5-methylthiopentene dioxygenase
MNATLTSTLRVYDDANPASLLVDTTDRAEIARILGEQNVVFERWDASQPLTPDADQDAIIAAYAGDIERLKKTYGYTTVDVIRVGPSTPNLPALREKFLHEHTHSEDEVRFFVEGSAAFYLRIKGKVHQMICTRGDLLSVPAGTTHWFDMGPRPRFTCIRFFTTPEGWVASFTGSDIADRFPRMGEGAIAPAGGTGEPRDPRPRMA